MNLHGGLSILKSLLVRDETTFYQITCFPFVNVSTTTKRTKETEWGKERKAEF